MTEWRVPFFFHEPRDTSGLTDPQDTVFEPVVNPPCWASGTAVSLNLTVPPVVSEGREPQKRVVSLQRKLSWHLRSA